MQNSCILSTLLLLLFLMLCDNSHVNQSVLQLPAAAPVAAIPLLTAVKQLRSNTQRAIEQQCDDAVLRTIETEAIQLIDVYNDALKRAVIALEETQQKIRRILHEGVQFGDIEAPTVVPERPVENEAATSHAKDWSYKQQGHDWPEQFCKSKQKRQSPIHIIDADTTEGGMEQEIQLHFTSIPPSYKVENNGHSIQISAIVDEDDTTANMKNKGFGWVHANGKDYQVIQMHFHAPAEHLFNDEDNRRALELHVVTQFSESDLLVVGVTFTPTEVPHPNNFFLPLLSNVAFPPDVHQSYTVQANNKQSALNLSKLFDALPNLSMYTYKGSLTTPPCSEIVTWYVLREPVKASPFVLQMFQKQFHYDGTHGNYREVQKNDQPVYKTTAHLY